MTRKERRSVDKYLKERNAVLRTLDPGKVAAFFRKHNPGMPDFIDPSVPEIMMHKVRLQIETFTAAEKNLSREWLLNRGYSLTMDTTGADK